MFETFKIPYEYLRYTIHIIKLGLIYSTVTEYPDARRFLTRWYEDQEEALQRK